MTTDNDKKAAAKWANRKCHLKMDGGDSYYDSEESFLAGCDHKQKELEQIKEQVAKEAFDYACIAITYKDRVLYAPDFNDYWQQKNKGENPILKRMNGDMVSAGNPITKLIEFNKGEDE